MILPTSRLIVTIVLCTVVAVTATVNLLLLLVVVSICLVILVVCIYILPKIVGFLHRNFLFEHVHHVCNLVALDAVVLLHELIHHVVVYHYLVHLFVEGAHRLGHLYSVHLRHLLRDRLAHVVEGADKLLVLLHRFYVVTHYLHLEGCTLVVESYKLFRVFYLKSFWTMRLSGRAWHPPRCSSSMPTLPSSCTFSFISKRSLLLWRSVLSSSSFILWCPSYRRASWKPLEVSFPFRICYKQIYNTRT